jgi:DNA-binding IclR family transcriptional regulator
MPPSESRKLSTLARGVEILEYIKDNSGAKTSDIITELNMPKSTVHSYLSTLRELGLISRNEHGYTLGLRLLNFGMESRRKNDLFKLAGPKVKDIAYTVDEACNFLIEEDGQMITIYTNTDMNNDPFFRLGLSYDMHVTAGGKAVLARLSDEKIGSILRKKGLPERTENTITTRTELFEEIERIRQQGFAVSDGELAEGFQSVGAAVAFPGEELFGAFAVGGPKYRIGSPNIPNRIPELLMKKSSELEQELKQYKASTEEEV